MSATVHDFPTRNMKPYIITLNENRKRWRVVRLAHCWSECWFSALNEFGKAIVSGVRPAR